MMYIKLDSMLVVGKVQTKQKWSEFQLSKT